MSWMTDLTESVVAPVSDPQTHEDAAANLRHTLAVYDHPEGGGPPDPTRFVVTATTNIYGNNVSTGLTWADLRLINEALHRLEGLDK